MSVFPPAISGKTADEYTSLLQTERHTVWLLYMQQYIFLIFLAKIRSVQLTGQAKRSPLYNPSHSTRVQRRAEVFSRWSRRVKRPGQGGTYRAFRFIQHSSMHQQCARPHDYFFCYGIRSLLHIYVIFISYLCTCIITTATGWQPTCIHIYIYIYIYRSPGY